MPRQKPQKPARKAAKKVLKKGAMKTVRGGGFTKPVLGLDSDDWGITGAPKR